MEHSRLMVQIAAEERARRRLTVQHLPAGPAPDALRAKGLRILTSLPPLSGEEVRGSTLTAGLASNLDRRETSPPGPLPIDGEGEERAPRRDGVGVRFPVEARAPNRLKARKIWGLPGGAWRQQASNAGWTPSGSAAAPDKCLKSLMPQHDRCSSRYLPAAWRWGRSAPPTPPARALWA
jgi:hypothetical protein